MWLLIHDGIKLIQVSKRAQIDPDCIQINKVWSIRVVCPMDK